MSLPFCNTYLHLDSQRAGLLCQAEDVLVAQPEVSADRPEAVSVLFPVTVE